MSLPDLRVDDRTYDDLLGVLRKQIPTDYTDHNPSDPLVMLLELFCWLGEMALYRMNRISREHEEHYLQLLADPPTPAKVPVTFTGSYAGAAVEILVPAGTRVATDFGPADFDPTVIRRSVFETVEPATIPKTDPISNSVPVLAREFLEVRGELLGTATGQPLETFRLSPVHSALGIEVGAPAPVLFDDGNRSLEYDPNPQVRTFRGLLNGTGGVVSPANGILGAHFDGDPVETQFLLTYAPPNLRLTRLDGQFHDVAIPATAIAVGDTEEHAFPPFQARIVLGDAFDKTIPIGLAPTSATVTGTGNIDSVALLSTSGSIDRITSTVATVPDLSDPSHLLIVLNDGFSGAFDGTSTGMTQVVLMDPDRNQLRIEFNVQTAFDGAEASATITLGMLANLIVHGGERWFAHHSLLTERSKVDPLDPSRPRHVLLRPLARTIQFGDGRYGALPTAGSKVVCASYQLIAGPPNLVEAGQVTHILTDLGAAPDSVTAANVVDASGGENFFRGGTRVAEALEGFRRPHRLVTADDFERTLLDDFNKYQEIAGRPERIARAAAIMNRRPPLLNLEAAGHVTVMVARELLTAAEQALWDDLATPLAVKQGLLGLPTLDPLDPLRRKIKAFLDERRLITTHVEVIAPTLVGIQLGLVIVIELQRNTAEMQTTVADALLAYLSLLDGGVRGRGWPMGRDVYRSEILRLVEGFEGVDHVESLALTPANAQGDVDVGDHQLPVVTALNVVALRP